MIFKNKKQMFCFFVFLLLKSKDTNLTVNSRKMESQEGLLSGINPEIVEYIECEILPRYNHFDEAHKVEHVRAVIADSIMLAGNCGVDVSMAYVIAAYHDTGMVDGREMHHLASGRIMMADRNLQRWFTAEQIHTMKEAVEDHRASGKNEPRSIYGKIVADADREIGNLQPLRRTIQYGLKNYPELDREGHYRRFYEHMREKYARGGYMHLWLQNTDKSRLLDELQSLIEDEVQLRKTFDMLFGKEEKNQKYSSVYQQIESLLEGESDLIAMMSNMAAVIHQAFAFWWTGFYRVSGKELILGPFQGPIACMHIAYGKGVCGSAWKEKRTLLVPDVHQFPGHIACSSASNSEIVVPVFAEGEVIAVLDIDSEHFSSFDETDKVWLEKIVECLVR